MPGLARVDPAVEGTTEQREVADQVEDLVAHELVPESKRPRQDPGVVEDDGVVEAAAAGEAAGAQLRHLAGEAERAGGSDPRGEFFGAEDEGQFLLPDERMGEVDLVGDRQSRSARLEATRLPSRRTSTGSVERERPDHRVLALEAGGMEQPDERQGRAVQDRDFRSLDLDQAIVETQARGGRENVLDRADRHVPALERRGVVEGGRPSRARRESTGRNVRGG